jgi:hypothetical protein
VIEYLLSKNRKQQNFGLIAIFLFLISVFFAPWRVDYTSKYFGHISPSAIVYNPVFSVPDRPKVNFFSDVATLPVSTLLWQPLLFTWTAIATAYAGLFFLLRKSK